MKCGDTEGKTNQFHPGISVSVCLFPLPSNILFFLPCFNSTPCLDNSYLFSSRTPEEYAPTLFPPSGGPPLATNIAPFFHASARDSPTSKHLRSFKNLTLRSAAAFSGRLERLVRFIMKCGNNEGTINHYLLEFSVSVFFFQ